MREGIRVVAFDLDDTLTVSKSQITVRMADLLTELLEAVDVCIISGGRFEQFQSQVLTHLAASTESLTRLHLMPTCGTRYYRFDDGFWQQVYAEDLTDEEKHLIAQVLQEGAQHLEFRESRIWGPLIEDRGSQITYSALGQEAPPAEKYAWDPGNRKKQLLRSYAAERLPDLEVRVGGSTSVDVTRKGVDKAYGIRRLLQCLNVEPQELLFVGDRLGEGGNDYPVRSVGVKCFEVGSWEDTARFVDEFLHSSL